MSTSACPLTVVSLLALSLGAGAAPLVLPFDGSLEADGRRPVRAERLSFVPGVSGSALQMPTNGWLEYDFPTNALTEAAGSVSVWVRHDADPRGGFQDRDRNLAADGTWTRQVNSTPFLRTIFAVGHDGGIALDGGVFLRGQYLHHAAWAEVPWNGRVYAGEWHHVAMTYDRDRARYRIYLDGFLQCEQSVGRFDRPRWEKTMRVGCGPSARTWHARPSFGGAIDELRLEPRERSADEVAAAFAAAIPARLELLDWSVGLGETRRLRFRVRNLTARPLARRYAFSNGAAADVTLEPHALGSFEIPVRGDRPGILRLTANEGQTDMRVFELYVLPPRAPARPDAGRATLLRAYDCTRDYPSNVFNECGSVLVTNAAGCVYREGTSVQCGVGLLYRFEIAHPGRPHRLEIDFPDDAKREFTLAVYPENFGYIANWTLDCAGIFTGVDQPLSGRLRTKELIFWPDSPAIAAAVFGYMAQAGTKPPAAAALRLYELDALPPAKLRRARGLGDDAPTRTMGVWDEDPTMDSDLAVNRPFNYPVCDLDFWFDKWTRTIDYMDYEALDTWVIKALSYQGDVTAMGATLGYESPWISDNGRVRGWAELGADMLERAGKDIWIRYNHKTRFGDWFARLAGLDDPNDVFFHGVTGAPLRAAEQVNDVNFLRPGVMEAYRRIIRAYRDKFRIYPHFRGITLNESPSLTFGSLQNGYDDFTIGLFTKETGLEVKGATALDRYRYLKTDAARLAKWTDWRCRRVTAAVRDLVRTMREDGNRYELQFWAWCSFWTAHNRDWFGWNPDVTLREAGIDLKALAAIDGLRVLPCVRPNRFRAWGDIDSNEYHFPYDARFRDLVRASGTRDMMLYRHGNLEVWTGLIVRTNCWKRPFWATPGTGFSAGHPRFSFYATPHPVGDYAIESIAGLVADYDIQDYLHGFWGLPEVGEHARFRTFYSQFRSLPRGRYDLVEGANEPVAVRVGERGYYLVNREAYPVKASWTENGEPRSAELAPCEIRWVDAPRRLLLGNAKVGDVRCEIPAKERLTIEKRLATLRAWASAHPDDAAFADILSRAEAASAKGLYTTVRGLFWTAPARAALNPDAIGPSERKIVRARRHGAFDRDQPCDILAHKWWTIQPSGKYWPTVNRIDAAKERVECGYSVGAAADGLHVYARCRGGAPQKLVVGFDPLNNAEKSRFPDADADDVFFTAEKFERRKDGLFGYEIFVPYASLKGFRPKPGASIGFTIQYFTRITDAQGTFDTAIGTPRGLDYPGDWPLLVLPDAEKK